MNLPYAYKLLVAADEQRHGFLKLRGLQADHEVRLMAQAGLVEASFGDGQSGSFTSINRVTESGRTFLRAFEGQPAPSEANFGAPFTASQAAVLEKWKVGFKVVPRATSAEFSLT
jgi:hypothetical protein